MRDLRKSADSQNTSDLVDTLEAALTIPVIAKASDGEEAHEEENPNKPTLAIGFKRREDLDIAMDALRMAIITDLDSDDGRFNKDGMILLKAEGHD